MARGLVPYRDLFEQKGPLVYALHALASLISRQTFLGVYLLEIISLTVYLVLMWKTILLWSERHDHFFAMFPALIFPLAFLTVNTHAFALEAARGVVPSVHGWWILLFCRCDCSAQKSRESKREKPITEEY